MDSFIRWEKKWVLARGSIKDFLIKRHACEMIIKNWLKKKEEGKEK